MRARIRETKETVKKIIDDCLVKSGITTPMDDIVRSGDFSMLRPVCR